MRMHVHETDLAPEERRAFGALKEPLRTAVIRHRSIEQAHAIGAEQVLVHQLQMLARLRRREQVLENGMDHRKRAVPHAARCIARMQQIANACARLE